MRRESRLVAFNQKKRLYCYYCGKKLILIKEPEDVYLHPIPESYEAHCRDEGVYFKDQMVTLAACNRDGEIFYESE